jgi:hypothetical protein
MAEEGATPSDASIISSYGGMQLDPGMVEFILDIDKPLFAVYAKLNGMIYDEKLKQWVRHEDKALMSTKGADELVSSLLGAIAHRGVFMSNFDDNETRAIEEEILDDITTIIFVMADEWKIRNLSDRTVVMNILRSNMISAWKRPYNEGERNFLKKITVEKNTIDRSRKGLPFGIGSMLGVGK